MAFNLDKMIKVNKSSWNWWESSKRFKRSINFSEIFPNYFPSVTLKMRSRSSKSDQLVLMVHLCKVEENPFTGLRDILHTRL